jgi:hypothetical protein
VAFTSASCTRASLVVDGTIWGSKCFVQAPLQVIDDNVVEVVDVVDAKNALNAKHTASRTKLASHAQRAKDVPVNFS